VCPIGKLAVSVLTTDFGFKIGCPQAVFTLRMVIELFISRSNAVYAASVDISKGKAFDTVTGGYF